MIFRIFLRKKFGLIVAEFLELPCLKSSFPDHMTTGRRPYDFFFSLYTINKSILTKENWKSWNLE